MSQKNAPVTTTVAAEIANSISNGATEDIWYDATDYNDTEKAARIEEVQADMQRAADFILMHDDLVATLKNLLGKFTAEQIAEDNNAKDGGVLAAAQALVTKAEKLSA